MDAQSLLNEVNTVTETLAQARAARMGVEVHDGIRYRNGIPLGAAYSDKRPQIKRMRYSHEAMADLLMENPMISNRELSAIFDCGAGWISRIIASDSFQAYLGARREQITDPAIRASMEERFRALAIQSMEILHKKLEDPLASADLALSVLEASSRSMGYGARQGAGVNINAQGPVRVELVNYAQPQPQPQPQPTLAPESAA